MPSGRSAPPHPAGSSWQSRQEALAARLAGRPMDELDRGTIVVLPSITFPIAELTKITAIEHYEERMIFTLLLLRRRDVRIVYVAAVAVEDAVVDYFLGFLPDPDDARRRLHLLAVDDPSPRPLNAKLLERPDLLERMRDWIEGPAYIQPFNVTELEARVGDALDLPVLGPAPELFALGSKSGSRRVARQAGVRVLDGAEDLRSLDEVHATAVALGASGVGTVVVKLNNGFSGKGNAIVETASLGASLEATPATFCAPEESWPSFAAKIESEGGIVEELVRGALSPSVQLRVAPGGAFEVLSTHDQILGGPDNQVYLGCRYPARPEYRGAIVAEAEKVARVLAGEGVVGSFGIDFVVVPHEAGHDVFLSEINLRLGGTTHPLWTARLLTGGSAAAYVATDNLTSPALEGRAPAEVIEALARAGLAFDPATGIGSTLHLLGALRRYGKLGAVCIDESPEAADDLYRRTVEALTGTYVPG